MALTNGQVLNDRYRIVKLLSEGGFGAVYRAWDGNLNRPCAVKENLDTTPDAQQQFEREARILAEFNHPHLARVIDYFFIPGQGQYLVMDFVEGQDLQEMLDQSDGPLPATQVIKWTTQVCDGLSYLHTQDPPIIHRDIKPANIKITPRGRAVLVDFGIAKIYDPTLKTIAGARAMTPGFSPVEQYGGGSTNPRSDIYSLGATLYTLLTGIVPQESVQRFAEDELAPPKELNPRINNSVNDAILQAMQLDALKRFPSADRFKDAILGRPLGYVQRQSRSFVQAATAQARMVGRIRPGAGIRPQQRALIVFLVLVASFISLMFIFREGPPEFLGSSESAAPTRIISPTVTPLSPTTPTPATTDRPQSPQPPTEVEILPAEWGLTVTVPGLNVRDLPGTNSRVIGAVYQGDILTTDGYTEEVEGIVWYLITTTDGLQGWVSGEFVDNPRDP